MSKKESPVKKPGTFVKINEDRLIKSSIKRYIPVKNASINVYFNTSTQKPEVRTYKFATNEKQKEMLNYLDSIYL